MKVSRINLLNTNFTNSTVINPYMYTVGKNNNEENFSFKNHKLEYFGGVIALALAMLSLGKFSSINTLPKSIVNITKKDIGLNKIRDNEAVIDLIKNQILYPMKSVNMGKKRLLLGSDFKTGLIISSKSAKKAKEFLDAFIEHAEYLGIESTKITRLNKKNQISQAYKTLNQAENKFITTGQCQIANIGDLSDKTKLMFAKTNLTSKFEKRLATQKPGVLWVTWTDKATDLPYFYNNLPSIIVKID